MVEAGVEAGVEKRENDVGQVDDACPGDLKMSADRKILT